MSNIKEGFQRNKFFSAYGGVGTIVETKDNLSYKIKPFNKWGLHSLANRNRDTVEFHSDIRLIARLKQIGFNNLSKLYLLHEFEEDTIKTYLPQNAIDQYMVKADFFPKFFYCPRCKRLHPINTWRYNWEETFNQDDFGNNVPSCSFCSRRNRRNITRVKLMQIRFVMASMDNGEIIDIPWTKLYHFAGNNNKYWDLREENQINEKNCSFYNSKNGGGELIDMGIKYEDGTFVSMSRIFPKYFIKKDGEKDAVYRPVVKIGSGVYFAYTISSIFIPTLEIDDNQIAHIKDIVVNEGRSAEEIKNREAYKNQPISVKDIQAIIDNGFKNPKLKFTDEISFRKGEFNDLTRDESYDDQGEYISNDRHRLIAKKHTWNDNVDKCKFISQLYLLKRLNVTTAHIAYSRIDKISTHYLDGNWKGQSENPKQWLDCNTLEESSTVSVALHPTCENRDNVSCMPVYSAFGEGFLVELNLESIENRDKEVFMHTFCHLIMKALEYKCGYPLSSMTERLYNGDEDNNEYGFMIYCVNGEAGSYGGISTLFNDGEIEKIISLALDLASDCPNDPICSLDGSNCYACVHIPETACEKFNANLNRNIINKYNNPKVFIDKELDFEQNGAGRNEDSKTDDINVIPGEYSVDELINDISVS